jgi:alpha-tubulin suppressor-like RCC1 family protein
MSQLQKLFAWGANDGGRLGLGTTTTPITTPTQVGSRLDWAIVSQSAHTLAITQNGELWAWGDNFAGRTGLGTTTGTTTTPTRIGTASNWAYVSAGGSHSLAVTTNGELWAWGNNSNGELGLGNTTSPVTTPTRVGSGTNWAKVSAGGSFSMALTTNGQIWSSGRNDQGQLGINSTTSPVTTFTREAQSFTWTDFSAGSFHALAIRNNGEMRGWGRNTEGQVGRGNFTSPAIFPTQVGTATNWLQVSAGEFHSLAVTTNGQMWSWGAGADGQLGISNSTTNRSAPVRFDTASNWLQASAVGGHSLGVKTNGTLFAWGGNINGQLGLGNSGLGTNRLVPTQVGSSTNWITANQGGGAVNNSSAFEQIPIVIKNFDAALASVSNLGLTAEILKIKSAAAELLSEITLSLDLNTPDQFYIDPGYIDQGYYVYIAESTINLDSEFTLEGGPDPSEVKDFEINMVAEFATDAQAGKIIDGQITAQVSFSQTATISHILGADLFAFGEAQLAALANRIRDNNTEATAVFDVGVDYIRIIQALVDADTAFDLNTDVVRIRNAASALDAAFSIDVEQDKIVNGQVTAASNFQQTLDIARTRNVGSSQNSNFQQTLDVGRIRDNSIAANSVFTQTATVFRQQSGSAALASQATITIDAVKITDTACEQTAVFVQTAEPVKTVDAVPVLASIATKLTVAFKNATGTILIEPKFSQSTLIGKIHSEPTIGSFINGVRFKQSNTETPNTTTFGDRFIVFGRQFRNFNLSNAGNPLSTYAIAFWGKDLDGKMLSQVVGFWGGQGGAPGIIFNKPQRKVTIEQQYGTGVVWDGVDSHGWRHYLFVQNIVQDSGGVQLFVDGVQHTQRSLKSGSFQGTPITTDNIQIFPEDGWMLGARIVQFEPGGINGSPPIAKEAQSLQGALRQFVVYYDRPAPPPDSGFGSPTTADDKPEYPDFFQESNRLKLFNNQFVDIGPIGTSSGLPWPNVYIPLDNSFEITSTTNKGNSWGWVGAGDGSNGYTYRSLPGTWKEIDSELDTTQNSDWSGLIGQYVIGGVSASDFTNEFTPIFARARLTVGVTTVSLFIGGINALATLSFEGTLIKDYTADLAVTAELLAAPIVNGILSSELQAETALEAVNQRIRFFDSEFTAATDITAVIGLQQSDDITASAEFALTADVTVIEPIRITADISAESTLSTVVGYLRSQNIVIDSTADVVVEAIKVDPTRIDADLAAEFTQTANVQAVIDNLINAGAVSTLSIDATVIPPIRIDADLFTAATLSVSTNYLVDSTAELESLSEVNVDYIRQRDNDITAAANSELDTETVKFTGIVADLTAFAFKLTAGDVINIDPSLQLKITREQRVLFIEPETRALTILDENRVFYVE